MKYILFFTLLFSSFLIAKSSFAWYEDFEDYGNSSSLNDERTEWVNSSDFFITSNVEKNTGTYSGMLDGLTDTSLNGRAYWVDYQDTTGQNDWEIYFSVNLTNSTTTKEAYFGFQNSSGQNYCVFTAKDGEFGLYERTGATSTPYVVDTWYDISMIIDFDDTSCSLWIDNEKQYSDEFYTDGATQNQVRPYFLANLDDIFYIDDIGSDTPVPPTPTDVFEDIYQGYDNPYYENPAYGISWPNNTLCYFGQSCDINITHNSSMYGYELYLLPPDAEDISDALDSATIVYSQNMQTPLTATSSASVYGEQYYDLFVYDTNGYGTDSRLYKDLKVTYLDSTELLSDLTVYDIDTACDDVATSTGDFWDDFRYGIECGFRKVVYWAFTPQPETFLKFEQNKQKLEQDFPYSVIKQGQSVWTSISTSTATSSIMISDFIDYSGFNGKELFNDHTLTTGLGNLWTYIYTSLEYILYAITFFFLLFYSLKPKKEPEVA